MNKSLKLDGRTIINYDNGQVTIDGKLTNEKLSKTHRIILKWLIDAYPMVASLDVLNEILYEVHDSWSHDNDKTLVARLNEINKWCGLGKKVNLRKISGINGYKFNPNIKIEWIQEFSIRTLQTNEIFSKPKEYIEPVEWLEALFSDAFVEKKVHVISGERGLGKTELARYFAFKCVKANDFRTDIKFENIIFTSYLEEGLENSIAFLECNGKPDEKENYKQKIRLLEQMKKPTLLIIDNYDNEERYKEELSEKSLIYKDLRNTGCHILITSKIDLRDCYGLNQTRINRLHTEKLATLFSRLSEEDIRKEDVLELIDMYLMSNTYLVRLAARLVETQSITDIMEAIGSLNINNITDPINGKDNQEKSLFEHFSALFNLSFFENDEGKSQMLYNLALIPSEGMFYTDFFEYAFSDKNKVVFQKIFNTLKDSFWVFLKHRKITMHPIVREMVARELAKFDYKYVEKYIEKLNQRLSFVTYENDIFNTIRQGVAAYEILEKIKVKNLDVACLCANLSSDYDIVGDKESAYKFGVRAYSLLESVEESVLDDKELYKLAKAYNVTGYAVLHAYNKTESLAYAEKALYKAKNIIKVLASNSIVDRLNTVNQGDIAALYIVKKDYQKALAVHRDNVILRQKMLERNDTSNNKKLLAAAYKGVATSLFYLATKQETAREKLLFNSYKYHVLSVKYYEEAYYPEYHFDMVVADNRKVGTLCHLLEYLDDEKKRQFVTDALERMDTAIKYLLKMEQKNQIELYSSLKNITVLINEVEKNGSLDKAIIEKYKETARHIGRQ